MVQESLMDRLTDDELSERLSIPMSSLRVLSALLTNSQLTSKQISHQTGLTLAQVASGFRLWRFRGWVEQVGIDGKSTSWGLTLSTGYILQVLCNEIQHLQILLNDAIRSLDRWLENESSLREIHQVDP